MPGLRGKPAVIIVGAGYRDVVALDGPRLQQVEPFALRDAFHDVHEDNVAQFLLSRPDGAISADVTGADHRNFVSQLE